MLSAGEGTEHSSGSFSGGKTINRKIQNVAKCQNVVLKTRAGFGGRKRPAFTHRNQTGAGSSFPLPAACCKPQPCCTQDSPGGFHPAGNLKLHVPNAPMSCKNESDLGLVGATRRGQTRGCQLRVLLPQSQGSAAVLTLSPVHPSTPPGSDWPKPSQVSPGAAPPPSATVSLHHPSSRRGRPDSSKVRWEQVLPLTGAASPRAPPPAAPHTHPHAR